MTLICSAFLLTKFLHASEEVFDNQYAVKITRCHSSVLPPDILSDYWRARHFIYFDNGLYGVKTSVWKHESQAKQMAEISYSGVVNIIPYHIAFNYNIHFALVYEDKDYLTFIEDLWLNNYFSLDPLPCIPSINSISENIETISHWIYSDEYLYRYVIELSDGTMLATEKSSYRCKTPWEIGSQVIMIGNSKKPCLINKDAISKDLPVVKESHYLQRLEFLN